MRKKKMAAIKSRLLSKPIYVKDLPLKAEHSGPRHSKWRDLIEKVERGRWAHIADVRKGSDPGCVANLKRLVPGIKVATRTGSKGFVSIFVKRPLKRGRKPKVGAEVSLAEM